ncbi:haloacid dehalogenase [Synergistales bacterium]|nr:haloacid dehalogenase [Synergistales bacterium]
MLEIKDLEAVGKKIRLIVCDLDGTLLNSQKEISQGSLEAIEEAGKMGVNVTICSGRVAPMLYFYVKKLSLDVPFISSNGGAISNPVTFKALRQKPMPLDEAKLLLEFCAQKGLDYCALGEEGGFFSHSGHCIERFERYNRIATAEGFESMPLNFFSSGHENALEKPFNKMLIYRDADLSAVEEYIKTRMNLTYTFSDTSVMDVFASGIDKGYGLRELSRVMGIAREEICAFGDYLNDIPMFREAGLAVATGNACKEAKEAADIVTASNDDDGVAAAIREYILRPRQALNR